MSAKRILGTSGQIAQYAIEADGIVKKPRIAGLFIGGLNPAVAASHR